MDGLLDTPVTVRHLQVGDMWQRWDIWNTCRGLERVPGSKIGSRITHVQPRDIFLRPLTMVNDMTQSEWEQWIRDVHL